jgi:hypothetical protein
LAGDIRVTRTALTDSLITDHALLDSATPQTDPTRSSALIALFVGILAIAGGYAAAFNKGGTPEWAPWLLALGIPVAVGAIMILGAARGARGVGPLKFPFLFVVAILAVGFCAALALPASESPLSRLWLGLPARAAVVIYGVGLLPIVVLPIAYALTFKTQTLSAEDVERVRELGRAYRDRSEASDGEPAQPDDE